MILLSGDSVNLLYSSPGLAIWTAITFSVVLILLWKFAWKPIIGALDARNAKVEDDLNQSKELREKAEALMKDYEQKIEAAKTEALQIVDEGRKDAEENSAIILKEAQDEAAKLRDRVTNEIEQAKLKALAEIEAKVVDLTVQVVSEVMMKDIDDSQHRDMISRELSAISKN